MIKEEEAMGGAKPDQTLDCRGLMCPMPVLKTKKAIEKLDPGQVLEVITTDSGSKVDIPAWAKSTGNELLIMKDEDDLHKFYIRKK
jgi:tRNA 2-thiouridine synthesizing protein A